MFIPLPIFVPQFRRKPERIPISKEDMLIKELWDLRMSVPNMGQLHYTFLIKALEQNGKRQRKFYVDMARYYDKLEKLAEKRIEELEAEIAEINNKEAWWK